MTMSQRTKIPDFTLNILFYVLLIIICHVLNFMLVVATNDFYTKNLVSHIHTHILLQSFHVVDYEYREKL